MTKFLQYAMPAKIIFICNHGEFLQYIQDYLVLCGRGRHEDGLVAGVGFAPTKPLGGGL